MSAKNSDIILKKVRLSFPVLYVPKEYTQGDGRPRWSATFLIIPGSECDKLIRAAISRAASDAWKEKAAQKLREFSGQATKFCYHDGSLKEFDGYDGVWALACHRAAKTRAGAAQPPIVVDRNMAPLTEKDGRPYAGCYVNAKVQIYAQTGENPGIRASFSAVQFDSDGDAFSSNRPSTDGFDDLGDTGGSAFGSPWEDGDAAAGLV